MSIENADNQFEIPEACKKIALAKLSRVSLLDKGLIKTLEEKIDGVIDVDHNQLALMITRDSFSPIPEEMRSFLRVYARMNPDCDILFY